MKAESYNKLWRETWGDLQHYGPVHRHTLENLIATVASLGVTSVLDVGCGSGENLAALATSNDYILAGVDISEEALKLARNRLPSSRLIQLDIQRSTLAEQFDLVMCIQVIEHVVDDVAVLRNIASMSKEFVFISTVKGRMRPSEPQIGHVRNYSVMELRNKIERAGLEVITVSEWGFPFYSPIYRSLAEWLPGGPPAGPIGRVGKIAARFLYHLYRLNLSGRGDVISVLARRQVTR